jgi:hypothetical protein
MRVIQIRKQWDSPSSVTGLNRFEVSYKMRGRGNNLYYTSVMARDEMEAFKMVRSSILASEEQAGIKNVQTFEHLLGKFPEAGYEKELKKARKILRDIRNEIFGKQT